MKKKVSIIIPCYNVEQTIVRCLNSIFGQKAEMVEYEVICIDDKSEDGTLTLLLDYEQQHQENMILLSLEENGKQGRARNIALDYAGGDYVMYVDADDVLAPDILDSLHEAMVKYQCDVAECNYKTFSDECDYVVETNGEVEVYDMTDVSWRKACILRRFPKTAPWGRLYRRELLEKQDIFFPEGITMEDAYFSELAMANMKKYVWIPQTLYFYYINPNGTYYNKKANSYYMDSMIVQNAAVDKIQERGLLPACGRELEYLYFLKAFCDPVSRMLKSKDFFCYENYCRAYRELMERFPAVAENPYVRQSETELLMFSRELSTRLFSERELAMAMYGGDYQTLHSGEAEDGTRVSVLIVTSNQKERLCETLDSLMRQSYEDVEIVVIDDASVDGTLEMVQALYGSADHFLYLQNETVQGLSASYNIGEANASGTWITFAGCGDKWHPDRLKRQMEIMQPGYDWNYCEVAVGNQVYPRNEWEIYKRRGMLMPTLFLENQISLKGVILKRSSFEEIGGFDEDMPEQQEYDFLLRLAESGYGKEVRETLVSAREMRGTLAHAMAEEAVAHRYIAADVYMLTKYARQLSRFGLKREKFAQTVEHAGLIGKWNIFWEYMDFLCEDTEYAEIRKEYCDAHNIGRHRLLCDESTVRGIMNCTGCAVCAEVCPAGAVTMKYDEGGFLVPEIDEQKCLQCGKCVRHCPTQRELHGEYRKAVCHAVQAADTFREQGSSGGIFPLLAEYIMEQGGSVVGAVFDADFSVKHVVSCNREEVARMYGSKYVQSDMRGIYAKIEMLLKSGMRVLFSGVACQVAGLKAYLAVEYDNLYTIDVVCHGVPSPGVWKAYLASLPGEGIREIHFRSKKHLGWSSGLYIQYADGREICKGSDTYIKSFLNNWILRDCCYRCEFKGESYSDITLGDFWGIEQINDAFDNMGTSFVTLNSAKGENLYEKVSGNFVINVALPTNIAVRQNPCIERPAPDNRMHPRFKRIWRGGDWKQAVRESYNGLHFDIALVCLWSSNYGNAITNYALYKTVEKYGSVIGVDAVSKRLQNKFEVFADKYSQRSSEIFPGEAWDMVAEYCDTFLVGSDQVWNSRYASGSNWGTFFQLGFVGKDKRKISYASSFGQRGLEPSGETMKKLYQEFTRISVREEFGINACREKYQVFAEQVLDPVFLLDREEYDGLVGRWIEARKASGKSLPENGAFIAAYLLDPTVEKREFCEQLKKKTGGSLEIIYLIDAHVVTRDASRHILQFENVKAEVEVEEWLYYLQNAEYVITDSFHGTCFSVLFHKPFLTFVNRQTDRFKIFEKLPDISGRVLQTVDPEECERIFRQIDYGKVDKALLAEREKSMRWLEESLKA